MHAEALETFGEILMEKVRDEAIDQWEMIIDGQLKSQRAKNYHKRISKLDTAQKKLVHDIIVQVVDGTIHHLLWTLEQDNRLRFMIETKKGLVNIESESDGLTGETYGEQGWIAKFSKKTNPY